MNGLRKSRILIILSSLFLWCATGWGAEGPQSSAAVEATIRGLSRSATPEDLTRIVGVLARLEDATEQERLQQLLNERITQLFGPAVVEPPADLGETATPVSPAEPMLGVDPEILRFEIQALRFGPEATADDLRRKDEVVAKIAGIQDPNVRYEALAWLEEQERVAGTSDH